MTTVTIVMAVICFIAAVLLAVMAVRQLRCKGYCLNNADIYASKEERDRTDYTPYYRQSGIVFLMIAALTVLNGLYFLLEAGLLLGAAAAVMTVTLVYAVSSSVKIEKAKKNKE